MITFDSPVRGSTKIVCLLGNPVAHSFSPQIHNHAFKQLGLNYVYVPLSVPDNSLHTAVYAIRSFGFAGANVTIPYKQRIINYCDSISDLSKKTGTVNTLYFKDNTLRGTTTDFEGFKRSITSIGWELSNSDVVILGNGGTARTLATALALEKEIHTLTIAGRNSTKAQYLAGTVEHLSEFKVRAVGFTDPDFKEIMKNCTLLINTTSAGMHPNVNESPIPAALLHKKMNVFDAIYNPAKTRLLTDAENCGCQIHNGLRMLLFQGLASFKFWTGVDVPESLYSIEYLQKLINGD